jgi:hypothetical protein
LLFEDLFSPAGKTALFEINLLFCTEKKKRFIPDPVKVDKASEQDEHRLKTAAVSTGEKVDKS